MTMLDELRKAVADGLRNSCIKSIAKTAHAALIANPEHWYPLKAALKAIIDSVGQLEASYILGFLAGGMKMDQALLQHGYEAARDMVTRGLAASCTPAGQKVLKAVFGDKYARS